MPRIELSTATYARLQSLAVPFEETPEDVIIRLLDRSDGKEEQMLPSTEPHPSTLGDATPQRRYERPIIESLRRRGGSAPIEDVIDDVFGEVREELIAADYEPIATGTEPLWRNRVRWARKELEFRKGLIKPGSPRGIWELTERGWLELP